MDGSVPLLIIVFVSQAADLLHQYHIGVLRVSFFSNNGELTTILRTTSFIFFPLQ